MFTLWPDKFTCICAFNVFSFSFVIFMFSWKRFSFLIFYPVVSIVCFRLTIQRRQYKLYNTLNTERNFQSTEKLKHKQKHSHTLLGWSFIVLVIFCSCCFRFSIAAAFRSRINVYWCFVFLVDLVDSHYSVSMDWGWAYHAYYNYCLA